MTIAAILEGRDANVVSVSGETKVIEAIGLLAQRRIGALPVMKDEKVAGIFSERDVIYSLERMGAGALDTPVVELMTSPAVTVKPDDSVLGALSLMTRRRIRHLPVVDGDRLVGFVSIGDLVKYRITRIEAEADAMREYIQAV